MRTIIRPAHKTRGVAIPSGFVWLREFNSQEQAEFISGLLARVLTAIESNNWSLVSEWVEEWKATANIYADPEVLNDVRQALRERETDKAVDWETLRKELGL